MSAYILIRSGRRTLSLEVNHKLEVVVRAPAHCSQKHIDAFVTAHTAWIEAHLEKQRHYLENHPEPDETQRAALIAQARTVLPVRVAHFSAIMGLSPGGLRITNAEKRFGSCSGKNRLCFSWRLMQYPQEAVDYVVVHELAHIVHKNHGPAFYALVASVLPDYRTREKQLRT